MCCTSDLLSLQDHEEEGTWLSVPVFMHILYVSAVEG